MSFRIWRPSFAPVLSIAGMLLLSYILGAAVIRYRLVTSQYLLDAFDGADAWTTQQKELAEMPPARSFITLSNIDKPDKTYDGFTLFTTTLKQDVRLMNMRGEVVHQWYAPFHRVWPRPTHLRDAVPDDKIYVFGCYLYPNGDLLAIYHGSADTPYGYGLAKLDKDSNIVWKYSVNAHHALDVGPDGTIYVLTQRIVRDLPKGLENFSAPALVDDLVLLTPDGKERKTIPLLTALRDSPFAPFLTPGAVKNEKAWDILHTNFVEVLRPELADKFPMFRPGQVMLSLRELDALIVLDPEGGAVQWAARGPWRGQHDPHFLDNGRILVFDNRGTTKEARVFEFDPRTQACPWCFPGDSQPSFVCPIQGRSQRLPNGNTLIVDSNSGVIMEVLPDKSLVWSYDAHEHVPFARRYSQDYLTFIQGVHYARP